MKGKSKMKGTSVTTFAIVALIIMAIIVPPVFIELMFKAIEILHR